VAKLCHLKKRGLADRLDEAAHALLDALTTKAKTGDASLLDLAVALGVCVDKMLQLRQ
jgi:hypothetical protein